MGGLYSVNKLKMGKPLHLNLMTNYANKIKFNHILCFDFGCLIW